MRERKKEKNTNLNRTVRVTHQNSVRILLYGFKILVLTLPCNFGDDETYFFFLANLMYLFKNNNQLFTNFTDYRRCNQCCRVFQMTIYHIIYTQKKKIYGDSPIFFTVFLTHQENFFLIPSRYSKIKKKFFFFKVIKIIQVTVLNFNRQIENNLIIHIIIRGIYRNNLGKQFCIYILDSISYIIL